MNLPKRDYRKTGFGGQHKGICSYSAYRQQPPPSLPRRGGTVTIVSIIVYMCVWDVRHCPRGTDTLVAYFLKVIDNYSNLQLPVFDKAE